MKQSNNIVYIDEMANMGADVAAALMKMVEVLSGFLQGFTYELTTDKMQREQIRKFVNSLESRGYVYDDFAILLVYNDRYPEKSYFLREPIHET